jgi:two-component system response regulator YesN
MYKLLLVDDETATREGILKNIDWQEIGIGEVRDAKSGVQALNIAREFIPDILLTDIKMPKMNGITLSHHVREINPDCSILIMSGYSETDYLKSAIRLSAINFVDKPIDLKKLTGWIKKSVEIQNQIRKQKEYAENNRWFSINDTALGIIRNKTEVKKYIPALKELYPDFNIECKSVCIILKLFSEGFTDSLKNMDLSDITMRIGKLLCDKYFRFVLGAIDSSTIAVILFLSDADSFNHYFDSISESLALICKPFELFILIGEIAPCVALVYESYNTASQLIGKIFFSKEKRIIRYENKPAKSIDHKYLSEEIEAFSEFLKTGDMHGAIKVIENAAFHISMHPYTETSIVIDFYFKLILEILRQKNNTMTDAIPFSDYDNILIRITDCAFLAEIEEYAKSFVHRYFNGLYTNNALTPMDQIVSIIHRDYGLKDLTLAKISRQTYLSPPYICVKFKEITGKTFTRYLAEYRIEKSLELLKNKNNKISYIAEKVGFANGNYFTKTFRKIKGITPLEYRRRYFML